MAIREVGLSSPGVTYGRGGWTVWARRAAQSVLGGILAAVCAVRLEAAAPLGHGALAVEIGEHGVLVRVPTSGVHTIDGPLVTLAPGFVEGFGVAFDAPSGRLEFAGFGAAPDWADREPVELLSFSATRSVTRAGDLEITTEYALEGSPPYLLCRVTLANRSGVPLGNLIYTREWRGSSGRGWTFPEQVRRMRAAPDDVRRRVWSLGTLAPGGSTGLVLSYAEGKSALPAEHGQATPQSAPPPQDVPLSLWTDAQYPDGLPIGETMGVSWGDYDADGYIDLFACKSGNLWRNVEGTSWEFAGDLDSLMPPTERRYGSSFGDYNNDGLPDIATEPRVPLWGDDKMHLLKNLGGGPNFVDVAADGAIVDVQPHNNGETFCWADVNGDRNLDLFVPVYPDWNLGPGNFFLLNLPPTAPGGEHRFQESSELAGLDNPPGTARPEGAQFVDVDFDGDVDLFSNGTLYRNASMTAAPVFETLPEAVSGIGLGAALDEGAMFFDYDLDGDQDLFVAYVAEGVRLWENRGDGTFFPGEPGIIEEPFIGLNLGMSAEDWDNDGDIDFTTRQVFRRNLLVEEGVRRFRVATHSILPAHLTSATPAWGDWDRDGDLDCALGNWGASGHFYENTLYGPQTSAAQRRHVRVRVVGQVPSRPGGLEVEYGATADLRLAGDPVGTRRQKFVASSHGYLNQNEYTLHFALPPPAGPEELRFDLAVGLPDLAASGLWRVDRYVNPELGDIDLAELEDRQIEVYRCGQVAIGGVIHDPLPLASLTLTTTTGGLAQPTTTTPLPPPTPAPGPDWYTGLALDTRAAGTNLIVKEIILDGQLDDAVACGAGSFNIALWDVTDPASPFLAPGGSLTRKTSPRDRRSHLPVDLALEPGRLYRLVARVLDTRPTTIAAPLLEGPLAVLGGTSFADVDPCSGTQVAEASLDPSATSLSIRFAPLPATSDPDPVGGSLVLHREVEGRLVLDWQEVGAPGYQILRCETAGGPCEPTLHGATIDSEYVDEDVNPPAGEQFWYLVRAVNACTLNQSASALGPGGGSGDEVLALPASRPRAVVGTRSQ